MHIIFVTTEFVTDQIFFGGLANFTANMAEIFAKNNHQVTVLVAGIGYKAKKINWKKNISIEYIEFNHLNSLQEYCAKKEYNTFLTKIYYNYRGLVIRNKINEINNKKKVDLVHYCNLLAVGLFPIAKIPHVVRISSFPGMERHTDKINFNLKEVASDLNEIEKLELKVIKKVKSIISPSKITAMMIQEELNKKVTVIESPFNIKMDDWSHSVYDEYLEGKKYLLFFGRLTRGKGIHLINDIIYKLLDQHEDICFVIIGNDSGILGKDGKLVKANKMIKSSAKEHSERVIYLKSMKKDKLLPVINNSMACVLPSIMDNLPNTCIEAMALGKIVIGAQGASFDQLIIDGYNGFLCENGSSESLYSNLEKFMNLNEVQVNEMSYRAKERINRLNPQNVYKNYIKYYNYVIGN